jgi:phosphatidylglycerol:prolipoprotein diacylglycerol transferase
MSFPHGIIPTSESVHPTPIYDMLILFAIFLFLWQIRKKPHAPGFMISLYLILHGIGRLVTEFFRTTPELFLGLTLAQLISGGLVIAGASALFLIKHKANEVAASRG